MSSKNRVFKPASDKAVRAAIDARLKRGEWPTVVSLDPEAGLARLIVELAREADRLGPAKAGRPMDRAVLLRALAFLQTKGLQISQERTAGGEMRRVGTADKGEIAEAVAAELKVSEQRAADIIRQILHVTENLTVKGVWHPPNVTPPQPEEKDGKN